MTATIASYWPFDSLPAAAGDTLSKAALRFELTPGGWLFRQGEVADALFVLVEGQLDMFQGDPQRWRKRVEPGDCIGELPLVIGGSPRRTASVRAVTPCLVLVLRYADLRRLLSRKVFDDMLVPVTRLHLERLELGLANMLGKLPLELLVEIDAAMIPRHLKVGEVLFEQGDPLEHVWLVDEGRLEVLVQHEGELKRVAEIGRGQPVGELAVLIGGQRSATVRALRESWLRGLPSATFEALLVSHPGAAVGLARTLARRLVRTNEQPVVVDRPRTIALLPSDPGIDLRGFARELLTHVASSTFMADRAGFEAHAPRAAGLGDDPSRRRFGEWLSTIETEQDAIVLLAGAEPDNWTRVCVEAADEVVLVAPARSLTGLGAVEREIEAGQLGADVISLVLCWPAGERHDDGAFEPWLELRPRLLYLHQVTLGERGDFARLGRGLFRG